jgi:hypothetical protein
MDVVNFRRRTINREMRYGTEFLFFRGTQGKLKAMTKRTCFFTMPQLPLFALPQLWLQALQPFPCKKSIFIPFVQVEIKTNRSQVQAL